MARIAGVDLPKEKRVEIGLTYIYGIGRSAADEILAATKHQPRYPREGLDQGRRGQLIRDYIDKNFVVEGDLRRNTALDIKRLVEIQLLPRRAPPQGPARARPAFQDERPYPQGSEAHRRQQEEVSRKEDNDGTESCC